MSSVLYISYDGMTDPLGQSQVLPYLTGLAERGFKIHLVSFEKPVQFDQLKQLINAKTEASGISWHPLKYHSHPKILSTLYDIRQMFRTAEQICRENDVRIVHCRSYIAALAGLSLKRKFGVKFLFDMRGFWADERVEGKIWNISNPLFRIIYNYFKKKEAEFLSKADAVVSLTSEGKQIIVKNFGKNLESKTQVIPCCADLKHFSSQNLDTKLIESFKQKYSIKAGEKILTYVGSLGTWYMTREMLQFFRIAKSQGKFDRFLILTRDNSSELLQQAEQEGVDSSFLIIRPAQRSELPSLLSLSEWSIFFIRPTFSKKASSPTKMAEILGMGKGIITNTGVGDSDVILGGSSSGILLNEFTKEEMIHACGKISEKPDPEEARNIAEKFFSLEKGVSRYEQIYKDLL